MKRHKIDCKECYNKGYRQAERDWKDAIEGAYDVDLEEVWREQDGD